MISLNKGFVVNKGFTLVELAIVITIIGLLIGGVLKGQELLQNARMTASAAKIKSTTAAVTTFKDIYKSLPGDMIDPANFIQGCTTAPCNVSGNRNGFVGLVNDPYNTESQNFWVHLARAGLVSGIDPSKAVTGAYFAATPVFDMGGNITIYNCVYNSSTYDEPLNNNCLYLVAANADGTTYAPTLPHNLVAKYDLKVDDGKAFAGDVRVLNLCGIAQNANYDPNLTTACYVIVKGEF